jgi:hypothetical protein
MSRVVEHPDGRRAIVGTISAYSEEVQSNLVLPTRMKDRNALYTSNSTEHEFLRDPACLTNITTHVMAGTSAIASKFCHTACYGTTLKHDDLHYFPAEALSFILSNFFLASNQNLKLLRSSI